MKSFREFYEARHGDWPGLSGEMYFDIFKRICDAQADYIDEIVVPAAMIAARPSDVNTA